MNMDIHKHTKYDGDLLEQIHTPTCIHSCECVRTRVCVDACINVHIESKKCVAEYAQFCMHLDWDRERNYEVVMSFLSVAKQINLF